MTPRKKWHVADDDRDQAAELINQAACQLEEINRILPPEAKARVLTVTIDLQKSLRLLERNGARTRVPEIRMTAA